MTDRKTPQLKPFNITQVTMAPEEEIRDEEQVVDKSVTFWGVRIPNYRASLVQVALVGFIAFSTVGMSIPLAGAGGGGLLDTHQSTNAATSTNATFAALAFFAGSIYNRLGIRLCLMFGGFGYALMCSAFLVTSHIESRATPFIVIAGVFEGISAALLWTAQGSVCMGYPAEEEKGRAFALFWIIFQGGAVIGSIIPICLNWTSSAGNMSDSTASFIYAVFIAIMTAGCFLPLLLLPSNKVIRADGTSVVLPEKPSWKSEIKGLLTVLIEDKWIWTLFPFFFSSNWFYTYQGNDFNAPNFTIRTRSFNALWGAVFNIAGAWIMGFAMDFKPKKFSRSLRAKAGMIFLVVATLAIWGPAYAVFVKDTKRGVIIDPLIDLTQSSRYAPYLMIYVFWSLYDGMFQAYAYWLMGTLSNNSQRLSYYSGWYKSLQSAGSAICWRLDGLRIPYTSMYLTTWMILLGGLLSTTYVVFWRVHEHSYDEPAPATEKEIEFARMEDARAKEDLDTKSKTEGEVSVRVSKEIREGIAGMKEPREGVPAP